MRTVTVTLAGRDYLVEEPSLRKNQEWRRAVKAKFGPVLDLVLQGKISTQMLSQANNLTVYDLFLSIAGPIIESPEAIWEAIRDYSPVIAADQERILDEARDSELTSVFVRFLELAYPFGGLIRQVVGLMSPNPSSAPGQSEPPTEPSLPVLSGASGMTS